jgi:hypothetical protein
MRYPLTILGVTCAGTLLTLAASAQVKGRVTGGHQPIASSEVTLWAASAGTPKKLGEATSGADGRFVITVGGARPTGSILYITAKGGATDARGGNNVAIDLLAILGAQAPRTVTVNEFTTIASAYVGAQFLTGDALSGPALALKIVAGNVPNFVDLETGGLGGAIQDPLNGPQSTTLANFSTLADVLAGCIARVVGEACPMLFAAATGPTGNVPTNTLEAIEAVSHYSWYKPDRLFGLLTPMYPVPAGKSMRPVPFMPCLTWAPSAWVLPLRFDGGGYRAGGKAMFDAEGNLWVGDNFTAGWQGQDTLWQGPATEFAPNGKPLSPITTGFTGGGMEGGTFGAAVDSHDNVWLTSYGGKSISVFDKHGKPLTPPEGITFGGRLGLMQGVIVVPGSGDVWVVGVTKSQLVYFPKGDYKNGRIVCEGREVEPCKSFIGAFHLGIDQQDRIWVTNAFGAHVTRFPASDPSKSERFKTGYSGSGLGIDSKGNVWVTNRLGSSDHGMFDVVEDIAVLKTGGNGDEALTRQMWNKKGGPDAGSVSMLRPDGTPYPGSPFYGGSLPGPWAVAVDGNDNIWISNFASPNSPITELCGVRTETCPPGFKTGDPIAPPNGYVSGVLQMQTDIAIGPAGDVWAMNNWQNLPSCFGEASEELSTLCGGQGVVIFFGMAKPVRSPQIGPARPW